MTAKEDRAAAWAVHAKVQLFFLLLSALSAGAYFAFRLPYSPQGGLVLTALGITASVYLVPVLILRRLPVPPEFLGGTLNLLTLGFIALIAGLSYVRALALPILLA